MKVQSVILCMGAMDYFPALYVNHDLKRAWFSNVDLFDGRFHLDDAERYGREIEYLHACQILPLIESGLNVADAQKMKAEKELRESKELTQIYWHHLH